MAVFFYYLKMGSFFQIFQDGCKELREKYEIQTCTFCILKNDVYEFKVYSNDYKNITIPRSWKTTKEM